MKSAKKFVLQMPQHQDAVEPRVLLHSCCAPCSSAILECMLDNGVIPTVFYCNPNIYPIEEYEHRRDEIKKHLDNIGVPFVEDKYNHEAWLNYVKDWYNEPERGHRCLMCFKYRLLRAAKYANEHNYTLFTTTLASSRWKNIDQINEAGLWAANDVAEGNEEQAPLFWDQNWRKGGLQERRNELLKQFGFYNQLYCGCEFSMPKEGSAFPK